MNANRSAKIWMPLAVISAGLFATACGETPSAVPPASKPALTVSVVTPQRQNWPQTLAAGGNVAAWQEAVIGAEIGNLRLSEVRANVGDRVKKGDVLARIASDTVDNEVAESKAAVAEASAMLGEAQANVERSRQLRDKGFYSAQQGTQTQTTADTAQARLQAAQARLQSALLKRSKASVLAPDDGIIAARTATVGSLTELGKELFRLIRGGRLEWRAEVTAGELHRLKIGQKATLTAANGETVSGTVRIVAPTVDPQTRLALVYVDLPPAAASAFSAGMFARGEFELGEQAALTLPQSAVLLRDGFAYVFQVEAADGLARVAQHKVQSGRRRGEEIEVSGVDAKLPVVATGAGFLADGDTVRVVAPGAANVAVDRKP